MAVQQEGTLVDRVSSELGYHYRQSHWSVQYTNNGLRLGEGPDPSVNVVITPNKSGVDPLLLRVETQNTILNEKVRERWKKLDLYLSHWYLVLPEEYTNYASSYFMHRHISHCTIIQWKQLENQFIFEWLPGIFKRPSTPELFYTDTSALDLLKQAEHPGAISNQLELY